MNSLGLAWLAGIIDGEGYIGLRVRDSIYKHPNPRYGRRGISSHIDCFLRIETTSITMLVRIAEVLDKLDIHYIVGKPVMRAKSTMPVSRIEVWRKGALLKLCNMILPYLVVKQQELKLVMSYLVKSNTQRIYRTSEDDLSLVTEMQALHRRNGGKAGQWATKAHPVLVRLGKANNGNVGSSMGQQQVAEILESKEEQRLL